MCAKIFLPLSLIIYLLILACSQIPDYSELSNETISGSIIINGGEFYTQSSSVVLSMDVPGADEMRFSNDNLNWSEWEEYDENKNWVIDSTHGVKTIYGNFRKSGNDAGVFTDTIIPLFQNKKIAYDGIANANFGGGNWSFTTSNIVISGDGQTVIAGAPSSNNAVYVYRKSGENWQETKIGCPDGTGKSFGNSIACTSDASVLIIGALSKPGFYLYEFDPDTLSYIHKNTIDSPNMPQTNDFAVSLSISDDGNRIAVGSWRHPSGIHTGAVYLYERNKVNWPANYEKKFTESDLVTNDYYGVGVKISGDGNTLVIGATGQGDNKGAVYIYKNSGSEWVLRSKFSGTSNYLLGRHIGMSYNGNRIIASERAWTHGNTDQGAAHIYDWNGNQYIESKILAASDGSDNDRFGYCVAMSGDGNTIAVSAPSVQTGIGSAYVYRFTGNDWHEEYKLIASDGAAGDFYGNMIAISGDASIIAVGVPLDDETYSDQGSVYFYY